MYTIRTQHEEVSSITLSQVVGNLLCWVSEVRKKRKGTTGEKGEREEQHVDRQSTKSISID